MSGQKFTFYIGSKVYQKLTYYFGSKVDLSSGQADFYFISFLLLFYAFHDYDFLAVVHLELALFFTLMAQQL